MNLCSKMPYTLSGFLKSEHQKLTLMKVNTKDYVIDLNRELILICEKKPDVVILHFLM